MITNPRIPGQANIYIHKERNPGECEGGVCVDVFYDGIAADGTEILLSAHINGADKIQPDGYAVIKGPKSRRALDLETAFQILDDDLVQRGLLPPKDPKPTP